MSAPAGARPLSSPRNLALALLTTTAPPHPDSPRNVRQDRAQAIKTATGKVL
jgi:hypothetical protein